MENQEMSVTMQERVKAALTDRLGMYTRSDAQRARFMQYCVYISVAILLIMSALMVIVFPIVFDSYYARTPIQDPFIYEPTERHYLAETTLEPRNEATITEEMVKNQEFTEVETETTKKTGRATKKTPNKGKTQKPSTVSTTNVVTTDATTRTETTEQSTTPTTTVTMPTTTPPSTTTTTMKTTTTPLSASIPHWWRTHLNFTIPQPCRRGLKYPHINCEKYHQCMADFTLFEQSCPGGTMYNPINRKCELAKYVREYCYRVRLTEPEPEVRRRIITTTTTEAPSSTTPPPVFNPPVPCEPNTMFPHVNCTLFYKCGDNGLPSLLTCPPSQESVVGTLFFNEKANTCDNFFNVEECTMGGQRTVAVNPMNKFNPPVPCQSGKNFPHPDCRKYYTCRYGVPRENTCLQQFKRTHFTTKGGGCVDATKTLNNAECNNLDERLTVF